MHRVLHTKKTNTRRVIYDHFACNRLRNTSWIKTTARHAIRGTWQFYICRGQGNNAERGVSSKWLLLLRANFRLFCVIHVYKYVENKDLNILNNERVFYKTHVCFVVKHIATSDFKRLKEQWTICAHLSVQTVPTIAPKHQQRNEDSHKPESVRNS